MRSSRRARAVLSRLSAAPKDDLGRLALRYLTTRAQFPGFGVVHVRLPPRSRHLPVRHLRTREWFIVIKGRGAGVIGGRRVAFRPGVMAYMPPGVVHHMSTARSAMEALVVFSPPLDTRKPGADVQVCC